MDRHTSFEDAGVGLLNLHTNGPYLQKGSSDIIDRGAVSSTYSGAPATNVLTKTAVEEAAASAISSDKLTSNTTVNFNSSQTAAQIQASIDAQLKDLNGYTLTFQFANGTYTLNTQLLIQNFRNGQVIIQGLGSETSLSTTKSVTADCSAQTSRFLYISDCDNVQVNAFKVMLKTDVVGLINGVYANNVRWLEVQGLYIVGNSTSQGEAVATYNGVHGVITTTYVSTINTGLFMSFTSHAYSVNNADTGTQPLYGLSANASIIAKSGTQPSGSTLNEQTSNGGVIR